VSLLRETMALADSARVLVRDVRDTPAAPGHGARLDVASASIATLRHRAESAATERIARARARRACLRPTSSPWERRKADEADEGAADLARLAVEIRAVEAELHGLADIVAFYREIIQ